MISTKIFISLLLLNFAQAPSTQSSNSDAEVQQEYENCIAISKADPAIAHTNAMTWRDTGGGLPAQHCVALSLAALDRYAEAAVELEVMASDMIRGIGWPSAAPAGELDKALLSDIYAQAGNAWLLADDPNKATEVFTLALAEVAPLSDAYAQLLVDRATSRATSGDYEKALEDLNLAQNMLGESAWLFVLKASAYRSLEKFSEATIELEQAFVLEPLNREGLLERGNLKRETGDNAGAREDWLEYLRLYPETQMADAIRRNIEAMDVTVEEIEGGEAEGEQN